MRNVDIQILSGTFEFTSNIRKNIDINKQTTQKQNNMSTPKVKTWKNLGHFSSTTDNIRTLRIIYPCQYLKWK